MIAVLAVAVGGALGAVARASLETYLRRRFGHDVPWWGFAINTSGAFALGLLLGYAANHRVPEVLLVGVGTGFIGAYTMIGPVNVDGPRLIVVGKPVRGAVVTLGGYALALCAATFGLWAVGGI